MFSLSAAAQSARESFRRLSKPEKRWVIFHPFIAKKAQRISLQARAAADSLAKSGTLEGLNGGTADAFRHAYWMASLVQEISPRKARKLGRAHEKGNYLQFKAGTLEDEAQPDSAASAMDLRNNEWGIAFGRENKLAKPRMIEAIVDAIRSGTLSILQRDAKGHFLDCSGRHVDMQRWKGKWNIPKCVVPSNTAQQACSGN